MTIDSSKTYSCSQISSSLAFYKVVVLSFVTNTGLICFKIFTKRHYCMFYGMLLMTCDDLIIESWQKELSPICGYQERKSYLYLVSPVSSSCSGCNKKCDLWNWSTLEVFCLYIPFYPKHSWSRQQLLHYLYKSPLHQITVLVVFLSPKVRFIPSSQSIIQYCM